MKTNILTGGLMMMLAVSCNSFLDVVPDNRTLLDSPDAVKEILVSAYPQAHYYHICEVMSDNAQESVKMNSNVLILFRSSNYREVSVLMGNDHFDIFALDVHIFPIVPSV